MELKHLLLLLAIPVFLMVITLAIVDNTPTGAATLENQKGQDAKESAKENNVIGKYSIMAPFRAKTDYSLEEYGQIKKELDEVVDGCLGKDIKSCLSQKSFELKWDCVEPQNDILDILNEFVTKFNECLNLNEDGVVCRFSMDDRNVKSILGIFIITLRMDGQKTKVEIQHGTEREEDSISLDGIYFIDRYENRDKDNKNADFVRIAIDYIDKKPITKDAFAILGANRIPLVKNFLFYKKNGNVKFIEEGYEGSFSLPTANTIIDIPKTYGIKLCIKSKHKNQFYAYDEYEKTAMSRDIVYRFAVTFPK